MIGCLRTRVRKQPIIAVYYESENELKSYKLEARPQIRDPMLWYYLVLFHHSLSIRLLSVVVHWLSWEVSCVPSAVIYWARIVSDCI